MEVLLGKYNCIGLDGIRRVTTVENLEEKIELSLRKNGGSIKVENGPPVRLPGISDEDWLDRSHTIDTKKTVGSLTDFRVVKEDGDSETINVFAKFTPITNVDDDCVSRNQFGLRSFGSKKIDDNDVMTTSIDKIITWDLRVPTDLIEGNQYTHKDGDDYVINKITEQELSNNQIHRIIDYSKVSDPSEVCVRTEKHFRNSFKESEKD